MANRKLIIFVPMLIVGVVAIAIYAGNQNMSANQTSNADQIPPGVELETATFGTGCFWCTEAVFQQLEGVHSVLSGYSGGHTKNPTYQEICTGATGHAEVVQIQFDPKVISFKDLLEVFWQTHDPTTPNRQGADVGTQYRSAIFYHTDDQRQTAEHYKQQLNTENAFAKPVVTEITKFDTFYMAEPYHQNYYELNGGASYCQMVIRPKMEKFKKAFAEKIKQTPAGK